MKKIDKTAKKDIEWQIQLEKDRQSLEARSEESLRAYLVNIELPEDCPKVIQESLKELSSLVKTLEDLPVGAMVQRRDKPVPSTLIGKGKAEEIGKLCHEYSIDYVVFDRELSPNQLRVLEKIVTEGPQWPRQECNGVNVSIGRKGSLIGRASTLIVT